MLNKTATTSIWAPVRPELLDGPTSALLRYALTLLMLCLISCLYFLQANELARLNEETLSLEVRAAQLESQNLTLKRQLAQWNSPAYVRGEALRQNYVRNPSILYVNITGTEGRAANAPQSESQTAQASR